MISATQTFTCVGHIQRCYASINETTGRWNVVVNDNNNKQISFAIKLYNGRGNMPYYFPCKVLESKAKWFYDNVKDGDFVSLIGSWVHSRHLFGKRIHDYFYIIVDDIKIINKDREPTNSNTVIPWDSK